MRIIKILRPLKILYIILIVCFFYSCNDNNKLFELKNNSGIQFNNKLSPTPSLNVLTYLYYYNGSGVASGDFNNDGLIDLYFTGNQVQDKLYLNKGNFQFEDITLKAGINNSDGWTTGVTLVDINNDGLLDIYVCKVGDYQNIKGQNLFYINQGVTEDGFPRFLEDAVTYNLDIVSFSTQSSFFDYDLDGDLDMFLLNHSVFPNRTYGNGKLRYEIDSLSGDRLFNNENGKFIEVSKEAGIFQGKIGYGLGISVSDVNNDGYPDIYIGNDFFENDYLYINQKNGTFEEVISNNEAKLGHTTHSSMGNDIADINNDGFTDIISLDMLPENIETYKSAASEFNNQIYDQYLKKGYNPQYMQNTLHLNRGNSFNEIAYASGIAATDWSWAPLFVDLDNDGFKDVFITNGIKGATNDMDFINFIANENIQKQINKGMSQEDLDFTKELPEKKLSNYFYRNNSDLTFSNVTNRWFKEMPSFSNGTVYADLDNDGDLDIVVNNVNDKAFILENKSETSNQNNFLKIRFEGPSKNKFGIGTKVLVYLDSLTITNENFLSRGYLSSVAPNLTIGIGKHELADSLTVIWPGGKFQTLKNIQSSSTTTLKYIEASDNFYSKKLQNIDLLVNVDSLLNFKHQELPSHEFNREPLIPYTKGYEGPKITIADVNTDGLDDIYIGGAKKQSGALYIQDKNGSFTISMQKAFEGNNINEDTDNLFFDADNDGDQDLLVVSGGNEFKSGVPLNPRLYLNVDGIFKLNNTFENIEINASVVKAFDFDADGDQDIVIGANALPQQFGKSAKNYIFENDGQGNFKNVSETKTPEFSSIGLIEDIEIVDINNDQFLDMIVVGHWMPISIFINKGEYFELQSNNNIINTNGWWNTIKAEDFDNDGDIDFVAGNWGLNTRLKASKQEPVQLYRNDFDNNGTVEQIVTYYSQGKETVFSSKDELTKQLPMLNKMFLSYSEFAKTDFSGLFPKDKIKNAYKKQVYELASCYFENTGNGIFKIKKLPFLAQTSSIKTAFVSDFDNDGFKDILIAGNDYEISTQLGRLDASHGLLLLNDKEGFFNVAPHQSFDISGPARDIKKLKVNGIEHFIVSINNNTPIFLRNNDN